MSYPVGKMSSVEKKLLDRILVANDSVDVKPDCSTISSAQIEREIVDLFDQNASALRRYARSLLKEGDSAQDAIQEIFLRYFKTRSTGSAVKNPRAWLFHVLRNYMLDQIRESRSKHPVDLDVLGNTADIKQNFETTYAQNEAFQQAVSVLTHHERECVQLHLEGFGNAEIAQILQIRARSVGALLTRSLHKIRRTGVFSGKQL
jgi:RNA polymerase sigma-70 factor, ECF subfamily